MLRMMLDGLQGLKNRWKAGAADAPPTTDYMAGHDDGYIRGMDDAIRLIEQFTPNLTSVSHPKTGVQSIEQAAYHVNMRLMDFLKDLMYYDGLNYTGKDAKLESAKFTAIMMILEVEQMNLFNQFGAEIG